MQRDPLRPLSDLPWMVEACVAESARGRRELLAASLVQACSQTAASAGFLWLGAVEYAWRFYFARRKDSIFFFFFRHRDEMRVVLDSGLRVLLKPCPPATGRQSQGQMAVQSRLLWPEFLAKSDPGRIVFNLGTRDNSERLELVYSDENGVDEGSTRYFKHGEPSAMKTHMLAWRLEPFLSWIETVKHWVQRPKAVSAWRELLPPAATERYPARQILGTVVDAFHRAARVAVAAKSSGTGSSESAVPDSFPHAQEIASFAGRTWLRLKQGGREVADENEDNPVTLEMVYELANDHDNIRLDVQLQPPDFLLSGDLHREVMTSVARRAVEKGWSKKFKVSDDDLRAFFSGADAVVMRVRRERKRDRDLVVLRGELEGKPALIVLLAWIIVTKGEPAGSYQVLLSAPPAPPPDHAGMKPLVNEDITLLHPDPEDGEDPTLPNSTATDLFRLMLALRHWGGVWL
jgi:hypothetical protein